MAKQFGRKASAEEYQQQLDDAAAQAEAGPVGNPDYPYYKIENGMNVMWMLPPMTSRLPWEPVSVHYKPFHVCARPAPRMVQDSTGKWQKQKNKSFNGCPRCEEAWQKYGFSEKFGETKEEWKQSDRFKNFKDNASQDKVKFMNFPLDALFTTKRSASGRETLQIKDNAQKIFNKIQERYVEVWKEEEFQKEKEGNMSPPGFKFSIGEDTFVSGIQCTLFSWHMWYEKSEVEQLFMEEIMDNGNQPWGLNDEGQIEYLFVIQREGKQDNLSSIKYTPSIIKLDKPLTLLPEFFEFMVENTPDVSECYSTPTKEEILDVLRNRRSSSNDLTKSPECFSDPMVFDPISDECSECPFRMKCGDFVRAGKRYDRESDMAVNPDGTTGKTEEEAFAPKQGFGKKFESDGFDEFGGDDGPLNSNAPVSEDEDDIGFTQFDESDEDFDDIDLT